MPTKKEIIEEIEKNRNKIKKFGVRKLTLIGSYAREEATKNSDIDLLVEFKKKRGLFDDYVHLLQFLENLFKRKVDLGERHLLRDEIKESILGGNRIETKI